MASELKSSPLLIYGSIITPCDVHCANYLPRALIHVENGIIKCIDPDVPNDSHLQELLKSRGLHHKDVRHLRRGQFLLPGFIDTHTHAPQFPIMGRGGQYVLLDWLNNMVFPTESKFCDPVHAEKVYKSAVRRLLDFGTTTCCYFSTSHLDGTEVLVNIVHASGQRAFIGNCNMDHGNPPAPLDASAEESFLKSRKIISCIHALKSPLIHPILSPRFALSCTEELMNGLADLALENPRSPNSHHHHHHHHHNHYHHPKLPIETHISENLQEVRDVASRFDGRSYAGVYDDFGLLGPTTILGHGCHLSCDEITLIKERGAGISHCPTSNFYLNSGVAKVGEWLDEGVKVGLGTDVSGGFSPSMITAVRHASMASKVLAIQAAAREDKKPCSTSTSKSVEAPAKPDSQCFADKPLPLSALLYIATLGGAELCNLEAHTGSLEVGKAFDALLVDVRPEAGNPAIWWDDEVDDEAIGTPVARLEASLERFFLGGDDRNVSAVWVEGKLVGGRQFHTHRPTA